MLRKIILLIWVAIALAGPGFAKDKEKFAKPSEVRLDGDGKKWAEKTLKKLSLEQKIGQMLMVWARVEFLNVSSPEYTRLRDTMRRYHLGGFGVTVPTAGPVLLKSEPLEAAALLNELQRDSELPLLMAADFERGVSMRLNGSTVFPHAMAFGAAGKTEHAEMSGRVTAQEARAIGVHWNWFPPADVNSNPVNPIINTRAYGEEPQQVGELAAAYIRGARQAGMMTTAKHFPGHGDTATDSHLGLASVNRERAVLDTVELPPFKKAIDAGVDAVMVSHVTVPALEPDANKVASTSSVIIGDVLKKQLGFKGLVVTDALDMQGLMRLYAGSGGNASGAAAVAAVKAGNDMVLIPGDLDGAYNGLLNAVKSGEIPRAQIDATVLKILQAKASVGLHKARLVDLEALNRTVLHPENVARALQVAEEAVTLVRENGQVLPLKAFPKGTGDPSFPYARVNEARSRVLTVIFTDDMRSDWGRVLDRQVRARVPDGTVMYVDARSAAGLADAVLAAVDAAQVVIAAVYVVPTAGKAAVVNGVATNTVSVADAQSTLLRSILQRAAPRTVVVALGNPYVAADFPEVQNYMCTYSHVQVSEMSAVRALFGEIAVRGRLPVSIPNVAARGAGLERKPQVLEGGSKPHDNRSPAAP